MNISPLDLLACARRGFEKADNDLPALSLYGWAMHYLDPSPDEWDESSIHLSDYSNVLDPDDGACKRQLYHRLRGHDANEPTLWERVMWDQGFAMQVRFSWLIAHGLPEGWEIKAIELDISEGLPIKGHVGSSDLVLTYQPPGETKTTRALGIEFKTQRGRAFQYLDGPKPGHLMQARAEGYALDHLYPDYDVEMRVMYLDREGQNQPLVYPIPLDEEARTAVEEAAHEVDQLHPKHGDVPRPRVLSPRIKVRENKGPNSIYLEQPWMCSYCRYQGASCPGALPEGLTDLGIVAKGDHTAPDALDWRLDDSNLEVSARSAVEAAVERGNVHTI